MRNLSEIFFVTTFENNKNFFQAFEEYAEQKEKCESEIYEKVMKIENLLVKFDFFI